MMTTKRLITQVLLTGAIWSCAAQAKDETLNLDVVAFGMDVPLKPHFIMFYTSCDDKADSPSQPKRKPFKLMGSVTEEDMEFLSYIRCGHCKRLHPTWNDLGKKYNTEESTTAIGKVDCTQHTALCSSQDVTGYPTLKFFAKGTEGGVKYRGPRDLASLEKFMAEQLGTEEPESDKPVDTPRPVTGLIEFTDATFRSTTVKGKHFVKFYAPWCGHCQRMAPTWDALARSFEHENSVTIGKLDCTQHKDACQEYEVKGYPTLLWIEDGKKIEKYSGDRSHEDMKNFVSRLLGVTEEEEKKEEEKEEQRSPVVILTGENFESTVAAGFTFIKFYAPWCGHCKRMAPTFDALGRRFIGHEKVKIAKVDCTQEVNRELCREQQVNGFPTVFLYNEGSRMAEYMGDRSLEDMVSFVTSRLGKAKDEL